MNPSPETIAILLQPSETAEILKRLAATAAAMDGLAERWTWDEETPAQFRAMIRATDVGDNSAGGLRVAAQTIELAAEADLFNTLSTLHRATVKGVGIVRIAWAEVPERAALVAPLSASGKIADDILEEGEEWETAWRATDPAYVPTEGFSLTGLQEQIDAVKTARRALREVVAQRRIADARLGVALARLYDIALAWYATAITVWEADTPEGATLRGLIPTTYQPRYAAAAKRRRAARRAGAAPASTAAVPAPARPVERQQGPILPRFEGMNANGVPSISPGSVRGTSAYPGSAPRNGINPNGVASPPRPPPDSTPLGLAR